jgi:hypothetical protein
MHDTEIERILRASRTPSSGAPPGGRRPGVGKNVSRVRPGELPDWCGDEAKAGERYCGMSAAPPQRSGVADSAHDAARWIPEAEVERLRKRIRTSFCNSPHKKWYWTALLEMYGKNSPDPADTVRGLG